MIKKSTITFETVLVFSIATAVFLSSMLSMSSTALMQKAAAFIDPNTTPVKRMGAPMATSDDNVYIVWWSNKTGNNEVMFRASTDGGKTFADKMNLSNTPNTDSSDANLAASGNKVYITWWERNSTSNEPVARISTDAGHTFGPLLYLSQNGIIGNGK
ncbi:MAG: hypothetical protein ACTHJ7_10085 [Candidatus Nitrosocosmicus sp.]